MGTKQVQIKIGMRSSYFAPIISEPLAAKPVYAAKLDMGAAVKGYLTVTTSAFDVYGDDKNLVHDEAFVSGTLDAETTLDSLELNAAVYGHRYEDGVETSSAEDASPYGGYGYIEPFRKKDKSIVYRATFLRKVCANAANEKSESDTKKASLDPKMAAVNYSVFADNTGVWRDRMEFPSEAQAEAWLDTQFGSAAGYTVVTTIHGPGSVDKPAVFAVAGESVVLTFAEDVAAVFDNGANVTAGMVGDTYTIAAIAANHQIVAIWA